MGKVIRIDNREAQDALRLAIRDELITCGSVMQDLSTLTVPVEQWRKLARSVARELGRSVQTLTGAGGVHAILRDWPRDDRERAVQGRLMREAVDSMTSPLRPRAVP